MAGAEPAGPSDRDLVTAVRAGDRAAFAAVYDRYGDKLYDFAYATTRNREDAADAVADTFVRFAERLGQLRDPDRLRPWLYAIARHECLRLIRARKRVAFDGEDRLAEMTDAGPTPEEATEQTALRDLVWAAAAGLADRDRAMLDLHLRQGLDGAELGEAMGMSAGQAYVQLNRLRAQVERSLGALLVARTGREECSELDALLGDWDGTLTPLIRKRVARHIEDCATCSPRKRRLVSPWALLASVPLVLAPAGLRDRVLEQAWPVAAVAGAGSAAPTAAPAPVKVAAVTAIVAGSVALVLIVVAVLIGSGALTGLIGTPSPTGAASPDPSPTLAVPPGKLSLSTDVLDLGLHAAEASVTVTNTGGRPLDIALRPIVSWLSTDVPSLVVGPGDNVTLMIRADRGGLPPGAATGAIEFVADGRTTVLSVHISQASPPSVAAPTLDDVQCAPPFLLVTAAASVFAESGLQSVVLQWSATGASTGSGTEQMDAAGNGWFAQLGPFSSGVELTMTVEAVDQRGLSATGPSTTVFIEACGPEG